MKASDEDKLDEKELIGQVGDPFIPLHPRFDFSLFSNRCRESLLSPVSLEWHTQMHFQCPYIRCNGHHIGSSHLGTLFMRLPMNS